MLHYDEPVLHARENQDVKPRPAVARKMGTPTGQWFDKDEVMMMMDDDEMVMTMEYEERCRTSEAAGDSE